MLGTINHLWQGYLAFHLFISSYAWQHRSEGCRAALPEGLAPGGPSKNFEIQSQSLAGGIRRRYLLYLPENHDVKNNKPAPMILAFHGQTQPTLSMEAITNLSTPYINKDAIIVYPEGLDYRSPGHQWLGDPEAPPSSIVDDRVFVAEVLDAVTSSLCVDESRVYATGFSNGGGLVGLLACSPLVNRRFAAFAGVSAAFYTDASLSEPLFGAGCDPRLPYGRKLPILEFHGRNDSVIAYNGDNAPAPNTIPLPVWVEAWLKREGCAKKKPKIAMLDGGNITAYSYSCHGWKDVFVHHRINNFGHGWPSTAWQGEPFEQYRLGPTTWNATSVILDWFAKWRLEAQRELR